MRILGIDPSLTATGYIYLKDGKIEAQDLIKTKPTGDDRKKELERLMIIADSFTINLKIDLAVIEGLAFMARNTSALVQLSGLSYLIRERLYDNGIPFVIVAPTTLKKFITGKGNVKKDQIMLEVFKRYDVDLTDDNLCDAFGLAMIGRSLLDKSVKLTNPQKEVIELLKSQI